MRDDDERRESECQQGKGRGGHPLGLAADEGVAILVHLKEEMDMEVERGGCGDEKRTGGKEEVEGSEEESKKLKKLTSSSEPVLTPLIDFRKGGACSVAAARARSRATTR